ncbi:hypothetical protein ACO2Q2_01000 [Dyella sp. KRB-257]
MKLRTSLITLMGAGALLVANDLDYADSNRDHRISATEYARWARQQ